MTDEQWLWLFVNEALDADEKFESLCPSCQHDVTSSPKCTRCGKPLGSKKGKADFINPNFDAERFDRLSNGTDGEMPISRDDDEVDYDLFDEIFRRQNGGDKE